ncbi:hypothetical protein KAH94_03460 [bacterium]|nr:hypothetical protein [bacterium]
MNNSQDNFEKNEKKSKEIGIFLTAKQTSWVVCSIIFVRFFVFISGYFLGKKKAVEKFYSKIQQDSFADHIYYSMCSMYDKIDDQQENKDNVEPRIIVDQTIALSQEKINNDDSEVVKKNTNKSEKEKTIVAEIEKSESVIAQEKNDCQYYAELIGFGTSKAADKFARRLQDDNVIVSVKKRKSKTARGKVIIWYQVVSQAFSDKNDLIAFVDDISAQERLKDVRIVTC